MSSDPPPLTEEETHLNGFPGAKVTAVKQPVPLKTVSTLDGPGPNEAPSTTERPHGVPAAPTTPEIKPPRAKAPSVPKAPKMALKAPPRPPISAPDVVKRALRVRSRLFAAVSKTLSSYFI